jgi:hypothetical protein
MKMKRMISLIILLSIPIASAMQQVDYHGTTIKAYDYRANMTQIIELLDLFPEQNFKGLRYIKFFSVPTATRCGQDWWGRNGIDMFGGCWNDNTLAHELAHDKQYIYGDSYPEMLAHEGSFEIFYDSLLGDGRGGTWLNGERYNYENILGE